MLVLTVSLSGCASQNEPTSDAEPVLDGLSEALYEVLPVEEVFVTASDGIRLHNAVYRPDTTEPSPVFINFSPYWGNTAEVGGDGFGQWLLEHLVPRGYTVVLAAIRGTGHSEGCFEVASDREVQDLYEVIDTFANQEWSNGHVAVGGKSYDSTTQNGLIAKMPHPALKGVFHVSGITDMYRYNYVGGVPYSNGLTFTPRYAATYSIDGEHPDGQTGQLADLVCPEMAEHVLHGTGSAITGLKTDYWQERDWTQFIGDSNWNGSIFFVHGFQDWNVKPDHILPWITELPEQIRIKGWLHQDTDNLGHVYPMRDDWNETMIAWLDTELKGKDVGFYDAPAWDIEGTDGLWREMDVWPPEEPTSRQPDGELTVLGGPRPDAPQMVFFVFDNATRLTGAPVVTVGATATPDQALTAIFHKNGEWIGEAVLRAAYRDGLDAPAASAGQATYELVAYPMDVVFEAGDVLDVYLGAPARHSITAGQTDGAQYNLGTVSLTGHFVGVDAREDQPRATSCFAC